MRTPAAGGGWAAIRYALTAARRAGGLLRFYRALRSRNACKTCALGMGGQLGGMVNEAGRFPEVCKKSMQAMAADMQGGIRSEFWRRCRLDELRALTPRELEHLGRLAEPVIAGPDDAHYRPISWDEALDFCVEQLRRTPPDECCVYSSGRASNEAGFLLQLFARLYGTNNVSNCSYYCHQASGVGLSGAVGTGTATVSLEDLEHCDALFLIGANPASNHPRFMTSLVRLRRRGGSIVVINPLRETGLVRYRIPSDVRSLLFGSNIATHYVQPHVGGDLALLCGVAKRLVERSSAGELAAPARACDGFDEFRAYLDSLEWGDLERAAGVERAGIDQIVDVYTRSQATIFAWTMGVTHHAHGVDTVRAIANLALLRGMVGRPHAGLLPIRGHSNVQGVGSVGVTPKLKDAVFERLERHFNVKLPTTPGLDTLATVEAMAEGRLRTALLVGGNLFGASPDARRTSAAFAKLDAAIYLSTTLNTGHAWGRAATTLILPVRARDEEAQPTTQESMFNYVRMSDGGPARIHGARGEVEIIAALARGVLGDAGPVDWRTMQEHRSIRAVIAAVVPGLEGLGRIDDTRREFHVAGRLLHEPRFPTPSGHARFHVTPIPWHLRRAGELMLTTVRSEGQFNTVVYEEEDLYRGQERRDVILMSVEDMTRLKLRPEQRVVVESAAGSMGGVRVRAFPIRAGNAAMYYPEANALVPAVADRESRTPAYKSVPVTVRPDPADGAVELPQAPAPRRRRRSRDRRETRAC